MLQPYEFLEHTADIYISAFGKNLKEAFQNAALAMFQTMTDANNVDPKEKEKISVEGCDKKSLLYNWLEELLFCFETKGLVYSVFNIIEISQYQKKFRLLAEIAGEIFNPEKHIQKVGVKAVTYHLMEINEKKKHVNVKFILDI
jgi:SHS2 domain-containing protein